MSQNRHEIVIIGAGSAGTLAAYLLSKKGKRCLLLDAGPGLDETIDAKKEFSYQSSSYVFNDFTKNYIADDRFLNFKSQKDEFCWSHVNALGGRTLLWQGVSLRMTDKEFFAPKVDGFGLPWPIGEKELNPYYDRVENLFEITTNETDAKIKWMKDFEKKFALHSRPCPYTSKYFDSKSMSYRSLFENSIGEILLRGQGEYLTVQSNSVVTALDLDKKNNSVAAIRFFDTKENKERTLAVQNVLLCASTLESTRILLNSSELNNQTTFNDNILGKYLMTHLKGISLSTDFTKQGHVRNPEELIHVPFQPGFSPDNAHLRGWGLQVRLKEPSLAMKINTFGEDLPYETNFVKLNKNSRDAYSRPQLEVTYSYGENEEKMRRAQVKQMKSFANGLELKDYKINENIQKPGKNNHELGTIRMGDSPENSVLNSYNQTWNYKNLFVTDGSCLTTGGYQNPTETILALTWRACDYMLENQIQ